MATAPVESETWDDRLGPGAWTSRVQFIGTEDSFRLAVWNGRSSALGHFAVAANYLDARHAFVLPSPQPASLRNGLEITGTFARFGVECSSFAAQCGLVSEVAGRTCPLTTRNMVALSLIPQLISTSIRFWAAVSISAFRSSLPTCAFASVGAISLRWIFRAPASKYQSLCSRNSIRKSMRTCSWLRRFRRERDLDPPPVCV